MGCNCVFVLANDYLYVFAFCELLLVCNAKISTYLLEKSRVVRQSEDHENFHIFFFLFVGQAQLDPENKFALKHPKNYK